MIIINDIYYHTKAKRREIFYGGSLKNPVYAKAYNEYLKLKQEWDRKYWKLQGAERIAAQKSKPAFKTPKDKNGKFVGMYLPMKNYPTGFHFYDLESARKSADVSNRSGMTSNGTFKPANPFLIMECDVTEIHTIGQDHYGRACVAYTFTPIKIVE